MINFPEIDLKDRTILIVIFIFSIVLLFFQYFETKFLLGLLVFLYLINEYPNIQKNVKNNILKEKKNESLNYNHKISEILKDLKKYKKKNRDTYHHGIYYWKLFIKNIHILENDRLEHYNQYFDNSFLYLKKSVNYFQSISVSIRERTLIDGIKMNDYTNAKNTKEISDLSRELYKEGYLLLYNISLRLNKKWENNPNINNKQIILDHPLPNDINDSFDFYL
jgi:hypothetical protein